MGPPLLPGTGDTETGNPGHYPMTRPRPERGKTDEGREAGRFPERLSKVLGDAAMERLKAHSKVLRIPAGTMLTEEFEASTEIGFVLEGMLGMLKQLPDGRSHLIGVLIQDDHYGRIFDGPSSYRLEALTEARVFTLQRAALEEVLHLEADAEKRLLVHLLDEIDSAREWVLLISGTKVIERVASYLLILLRRTTKPADGSPPVIHQPLSRRDLARFLGTRPETLSRALHELEGAGAIRILQPHRFAVADSRSLIEAAGKDLVPERWSGRRTAD